MRSGKKRKGYLLAQYNFNYAAGNGDPSHTHTHTNRHDKHRKSDKIKSNSISTVELCVDPSPPHLVTQSPRPWLFGFCAPVRACSEELVVLDPLNQVCSDETLALDGSCVVSWSPCGLVAVRGAREAWDQQSHARAATLHPGGAQGYNIYV
jgi:hypothetical protein